MGIIVNQNENRSQLQERLAAELREKAKLKASGAEPLDQTKHSNYLKNTETADGRTGFWLLIVVLVVIAVIIIYYYVAVIS